MASWIKVRTHLATHPKVVRIACALCAQPVHILGALVHLWSVADMHADGECLPHMTPEALDLMVSLPGFARELAKAGWAEIKDDGIYLLNYQVHNGTSAKRRAANSKRMNSVRTVCADSAQDVRGDVYLEKEKEIKKKKEKKEEPEDTSGIVLSFPTDGPEPQYHLRENQLAAWTNVYRGLDVLAECQKARLWIDANPSNRKTAAGMPRFLVNWLSRATNNPRPTQGPSFNQRPPNRKPAPLASEMMPPALAAQIFGEIPPSAPALEVRHV